MQRGRERERCDTCDLERRFRNPTLDASFLKLGLGCRRLSRSDFNRAESRNWQKMLARLSMQPDGKPLRHLLMFDFAHVKFGAHGVGPIVANKKCSAGASPRAGICRIAQPTSKRINLLICGIYIWETR